jgi:hypothetical protein
MGGTGNARRGDDAGQTSTEMAGLVLVVTMVIGALLPLGVGQQIGVGIETAICRLFGGGACSSGPASHVPPDKCTVLSHSGEVGIDVTVFSVDVGGTGKLTLLKRIDAQGQAHWYVQQRGEARLGVDFLFGEKANLGDLGEGVSAEVKALGTAGGGTTMEFKDEHAAHDFMTAAAHEPIKQVANWFDPTSMFTGTGIVHWLADKLDGHSYRPPPPTEVFVEAGGRVDGSISANGGDASIGGKAGVAAVAGVKLTSGPDGPHHTIYVKLTAESAATLGLFNVASGEVGRKGEVTVGIEYNAAGKPVNASLEAAGQLKAQFGPDAKGASGTLGKIAGFSPQGAPKVGATIGGGELGKIKLNIDLTQGDNANVVADALHSVGVPVLTKEGSRTTPDVITGLTGLYGLFDQGAPGTSIAVTTYGVTGSGLSGGVKGGDGLTFGVEGGYKFEDQKLKDAWYYLPGQGFVKWQQCFQ